MVYVRVISSAHKGRRVLSCIEQDEKSFDSEVILSGMPLPGAPDVPMDRQMKEGDDLRKYLSQSTQNLRLFSVYLFPRKCS